MLSRAAVARTSDGLTCYDFRSAMPRIDPGRCPLDPEETAEAYVLGTLSPEVAAAFEDHYLTCAACAAVVEAADEYVRAMRAAAKHSKPEK